MHRGYIKLWRKVADSQILQNHKLWALWSWLLLNVTHKEINVYAGLKKIKLSPGQIITGRKRLAEELAMSERNIRTCLDSLRKTGNVTIKTTNKYSIITVVNWHTYQSDEEKTTSKKSNKRPASDQQVTTKQEHKNVKNIRKLQYPKWLDMDLWKQFKEHRQKLRAPMTAEAERRNINKLKKLIGQNGASQENIIGQSIENGWKGLFPLKDDFRSIESDNFYKELP